MQDSFYMKEALALAERAMAEGEVPVGAVIVKDDKILASAYNLRETRGVATAHAELLAIEEACRALGGWRLSGCTLYVTLEPCPMCAGAIVNSRLDRVVYGVKDSVAGSCGSVVNLNSYPFNHAFSLTGGILEEECRDLLRRFFLEKRGKDAER